MKHHAQFILFDMAIRDAWHGKATLTNGLRVHGFWSNPLNFTLRG